MGVVQIGCGMLAFTAGSRHLPAADLALLALTEVVLGPVWAWLVVGEVPAFWTLVGGARTDLSGLTAAEARTLFLVAGPSSAVTPEAKAALRKLVRALPETFRAEAEKAASAIVLDPAGWGGTRPSTPPHLEALQHAVIEGVQVRLGYTDATGSSTERLPIERAVSAAAKEFQALRFADNR